MTLEIQTADQLEVRFKHIPVKPPIQDARGSFFCCCTPLHSSPVHKEGRTTLPVSLMFCLNVGLSLLRVDLGGVRPWTLIPCNKFLFLRAERGISLTSIQADSQSFRERGIEVVQSFHRTEYRSLCMVWDMHLGF